MSTTLFDAEDVLAEVHERLGDLQKFNGAYGDAIGVGASLTVIVLWID